MRSLPETGTASRRDLRSEKGSSLVIAMFVLAMLTALGSGLLFLANTDVKMNQADLRAKAVFAIAESGLEDSRNKLRADNIASANPNSLDDELAVAAGGNTTIDLNVNSLTPTYDSNGNVTGFTGYGNDTPLRTITTFNGGRYAAFLSNDPIDGISNTNDTNDRVMITAIGTGRDKSVEIVQAIVERRGFPTPPSTIMLLGPTPAFDGGTSASKEYTGDDCAGVPGYTGIPGLHMPVIGTMDAAGEAAAETGVHHPSSYSTDGGTCTGACAVADVHTTTPPDLSSCTSLLELAESVRASADYICTPSSPCTHIGSTTVNTVTYIDGDFDLGSLNGQGFLWVTGDFQARGGGSWTGVIFVVGTGSFDRNGGGSGETYGSTVVANVAGPDHIYGNADDCTGPYGGFGQSVYTVSGTGTHDTTYCSDVISQTTNGFPMKITSFRQR